MKLIEEGQLVHVDNMDDVLLHFGTKGMKWGVRKAASKEEKRNAKAKYKKAINPLSY